MGFFLCDPLCLPVSTDGAAGSRIDGTLGPVRSIRDARDLVSDLSAGAEARVDELLFLKVGESFRVVVDPFGLPDGFFVPGDSQPLKVRFDQLIIFGPYPAVVDVLKSQEKRSTMMFRKVPGYEGCIGMTEVQGPGRAGGEARSHGKSFGVQVEGFKLRVVEAY